jgi:hypothetical protein
MKTEVAKVFSKEKTDLSHSHSNLSDVKHSGLKRSSPTYLIHKNNPLYFSNEKSVALEDALEIFLGALDEYAVLHKISKEDIEELKTRITAAYNERRAILLIEEKVNRLNSRVGRIINASLQGVIGSAVAEFGDITNLYYYKNRHETIKHG